MDIVDKSDFPNSRRRFLKKASTATLSLAGVSLFSPLSESVAANADFTNAALQNEVPWFRRVTRWGQTNITEKDPMIYDIEWWRGQWKRTQLQGVAFNCGGIVAYYPTKIPYHYQAQFLQGRDLFGELCRAAHNDGLAVLARMDSNRAHEDLYKAHPDWFAVNAKNEPYRVRGFSLNSDSELNQSEELYVPCVNGPYYKEHIQAILSEIIQLYHPEGFFDNNWIGLGRNSICYCEYCQKDFFDKTGYKIPGMINWDDPVYRQWIKWNFDKRIEIWDLNNRTVKSIGGSNCLWQGNTSGSIINPGRDFRDLKKLCERAEMMTCDHQSRSNSVGFQNLADVGKTINGLLGWDKLVYNSMPMYQAGTPTFRVSSKPEQEAHMWIINGIAGGLQIKWHHIAAYHEDRRMYHTAESICKWHKANEEFLINRRPVATVGVVWSNDNAVFYGRDEAESKINLPWRGIVYAMVRARIPYIPVHADHIDRDAGQLNLLILPNVGGLSAAQVDSVKRFVAKGGSLFATGVSSLYNELGDELPDYALSDLFKTHYDKEKKEEKAARVSGSDPTVHSYLRLYPEIRKNVFGPHIDTEPEITHDRHDILKGFEMTDILPFGGVLTPINKVDAGAQTLMTFIPEFPIFPPETVWMREPVTNIPGLIVNTLSNGSRIAFMPADIDSQFARNNLPDHGNLLANIIRWAIKDELPICVTGPGLIDCNIYTQPGRLIIHLVNLTSIATWRQTLDEFIPVGPISVKVKLPDGVTGEFPNLMVAGQRIVADTSDGWSSFRIASILSHELVILT